jgi:hypothetical protein
VAAGFLSALLQRRAATQSKNLSVRRIVAQGARDRCESARHNKRSRGALGNFALWVAASCGERSESTAATIPFAVNGPIRYGRNVSF